MTRASALIDSREEAETVEEREVTKAAVRVAEARLAYRRAVVQAVSAGVPVRRVAAAAGVSLDAVYKMVYRMTR